MTKLYRILKEGKIIESEIPGKYAGCKTTGIFGNVHNACTYGYNMNHNSRVFFHSLEDAVKEGYRPCKICRPISEEEFKLIKCLTPFATLEEFYNARPRRKTDLSFAYS